MMRQSTVGELKAFLGGIPDDYHVWSSQGSIYVAPPLQRDKYTTFTGMVEDTEEMRRQMERVAISDFDCPV